MSTNTPTPATAVIPKAHSQDEKTQNARLDPPSNADAGADADAGAEHVPSPLMKLGFLDRFLALWIFLAMAVGIVLGNFVPDLPGALQRGEIAGVSVPIAVGLLVMMFPILCKVSFESLHMVLSQRAMWKQVAFSLGINWIVAPLLMICLAWAFLPDKPHLRTGLMLVGLARCIAMVLVWNGLAGGDPDFCVILVSLNSLLQIVLFAPLALFVRVVGDETEATPISYSVVATSVAFFLGLPLGAAFITRMTLRSRLIAGPDWYDGIFIPYLSPWSLIGLLETILVLFASQGRQVVHQIVSVIRVAAPLVCYFVVVFFSVMFICRKLGFQHSYVVTQSFTAASNNFELAIAVAVATFGPDSDEALASTVGPLIEVPVLLALVYIIRYAARRWDWK